MEENNESDGNTNNNAEWKKTVRMTVIPTIMLNGGDGKTIIMLNGGNC